MNISKVVVDDGCTKQHGEDALPKQFCKKRKAVYEVISWITT